MRPLSYNGRMTAFQKSWTGYFIAVAGVAALTTTFKLLNTHINAATVALAFLCSKLSTKNVIGWFASLTV